MGACVCAWIRRAAILLPGQPSSLQNVTAQPWTALHAPAERSVFPASMATDISRFPRSAAASRSPKKVPVATDSLSAVEALRLGTLAANEDVSEEICTVQLSLADRGRTADTSFPHDTAESHATLE
ncbi:hypothetical protein MOQ_007518 [Trypanosoma cruzi marinkellei]|uniref:Uncharacterized protein n=1 Tax=Trypanosoma cruzi marinkellei TaxID=85056 RepID=K2N2D7_TRYCR|nr:hypothetical protein MOQ_007518 [Trypanosoma cruzi marinkellei]